MPGQTSGVYLAAWWLAEQGLAWSFYWLFFQLGPGRSGFHGRSLADSPASAPVSSLRFFSGPHSSQADGRRPLEHRLWP